MQKLTMTLAIVCVILAFFCFSFYSCSRKTLEGAIAPPYIQIENRTVHMVFKASNGTLHNWTIGVDALEAQIKAGYFRRELIPFFTSLFENLNEAFLPLVPFGYDPSEIQSQIENLESMGVQYISVRDNETGKIYRVMDFRPFVVENNFKEVINDLYNELNKNDQAFVHEVWYIVSQLTAYSTETEETPRYPLETMIGGGGDCEDMAILIASMLKAAPANYVVELVYMDADNPTDPQDVDHVIVWVETPSGYKTFVDGTSHTKMCPFTLVDGWYLEV